MYSDCKPDKYYNREIVIFINFRPEKMAILTKTIRGDNTVKRGEKENIERCREIRGGYLYKSSGR